MEIIFFAFINYILQLINKIVNEVNQQDSSNKKKEILNQIKIRKDEIDFNFKSVTYCFFNLVFESSTQ